MQTNHHASLHAQAHQESQLSIPRFVMAVVFAVTVGGVGLWTERVHAAKLKNEAMALFRDAGLPTTPDELDAWYEEPTGANAADNYTRAFGMMEYPEVSENHNQDDGHLHTLYDLDKSIYANDRRGVSLEPNELEFATSLLEKNREALSLLHEAANIDGCRYPINLRLGYDLPTLYLGKVRLAGKMLMVEARVRLHLGDTDAAVDSFRAAARLADSLRQEPRYMSQLLRIACVAQLDSVIERVIADAGFSDAQLVTINQALADSEAPLAFGRGIVGLVAISNPLFHETTEELARHKIQVPDASYWFTGMADLDHAAYLTHMWFKYERSQRALHERRAEPYQPEEEIDQIPKSRLITHQIEPNLGRGIVLDLRVISLNRCARIAIAIERYRLAEDGKLPDRLDDLLPRFLEAIPADPHTGGPLHYNKLDPSGYVVYSVNYDLIDDGGRKENEKGEPFELGSDITFRVER